MSYGYEYEGYEGDAPYSGDPNAFEFDASGFDAPVFDAPAPQDHAAGRGRRRRATPEPEPEPEPQLQPQPETAPYDPQWEHSGLGWDQEAWNRTQYEQYEQPQQYAADQFQPGGYGAREEDPQQYGSDQYAADGYDYGYGETRYAEPVQHPGAVPDAGEYEPEFDPVPQPTPEPALASTAGNSAVATADPTPQTPAATGGRGAFGAAGLAVITAIGAIAATPVLAVVIGLSQIGLAIGWTRSVGLPHTRRTEVLIAGIGLAAAVLAYRMTPDRAPAAMGAALGVGYVFLAADQLLRKDTTAGWPRSEALAAVATGAAFAVLPAGYLVAQRGDSALAGACALAAAAGVLCSALVGDGTRPTGILAGAVAGTAVGTLTAVTLAASAGAKGGALGGLISGLFAVVAARTADRLATEGSDVRISAQTLPVAFSAIGAVIAEQVLR